MLLLTHVQCSNLIFCSKHGNSKNADPDSQKLSAPSNRILRMCQLSALRNAMDRPAPGRTSFLIKAFSGAVYLIFCSKAGISKKVGPDFQKLSAPSNRILRMYQLSALRSAMDRPPTGRTSFLIKAFSGANYLIFCSKAGISKNVGPDFQKLSAPSNRILRMYQLSALRSAMDRPPTGRTSFLIKAFSGAVYLIFCSKAGISKNADPDSQKLSAPSNRILRMCQLSALRSVMDKPPTERTSFLIKAFSCANYLIFCSKAGISKNVGPDFQKLSAPSNRILRMYQLSALRSAMDRPPTGRTSFLIKAFSGAVYLNFCSKAGISKNVGPDFQKLSAPSNRILRMYQLSALRSAMDRPPTGRTSFLIKAFSGAVKNADPDSQKIERHKQPHFAYVSVISSPKCNG
ncbi:hypothetical protein CDAR_85481 [Caerostris darwini]|uniref:Uncharacterized protein n=1 Tax=Caerostris darwini TaxID=1538125 RepID=A0AAV4QXG1_9ARAC|nr:hypothetical protein CDAR_85481 [Caerostris darwini]